MKRILSLILSLALAFSLMPSAFAASNEAVQAAEALHSLGLFNGTGTDANGNPIYDLDRAPTRQEAITMLVRLLGKEDAAKQGTWKPPFTDVDSWAAPYVGYAYSNGLTSGTSATTFSGNNTVTTSQYLSFVLRALGYTSGTDFQWDKAWELSDKIGLTKGNYNATTKSFTRGDVAIISKQALSVKMKDGKKSLSDVIGAATPPSTPSDTTSSALTDRLWLTVTQMDTKNSCAEIYEFKGSQYSCTYEFFNENNQTIALGYEEGSYQLSGTTLSITQTKNYSYILAAQKLSRNNPLSYSYPFKISNGKLYLHDWVYVDMQYKDSTVEVQNRIKSYVLAQAGEASGSGSVSVAQQQQVLGKIGTVTDKMKSGLLYLAKANEYHIYAIGSSSSTDASTNKFYESRYLGESKKNYSDCRALILEIKAIAAGINDSSRQEIMDKCDQIVAYFDSLCSFTTADSSAVTEASETTKLVVKLMYEICDLMGIK